jgi:hypothetical protein
MENLSLATNEVNVRDLFVNAVNIERQNSILKTQVNPIIENLVHEGGENYLHYMKRLGLSLESDILILSSRHHYYYDHNDLKGIKILINIKKLNFVKHLDSFLHVVSCMLPHEAIFIGSFSNMDLISRNEFPFKQASFILRGFMNFLDSGTALFLNENIMIRMFESHGFKVLDMTEGNEQTYFSIRKADNVIVTRFGLSDYS